MICYSIHWRFRVIGLWIAISSLCFLSACQNVNEPRYLIHEFRSVDLTVPSRGISVPATFVYPISSTAEAFSLIVMAHGHAGTRHEAGGFTRVAEGLAARGIASIRMDFPGCGDSSEPFTHNNLTNMLKDIQASRNFAVAQPQINENRVGLLGFSMGGRLVLMLASENKSYKIIATWAPAGSNGADAEYGLMGGYAGYESLKSQAVSRGFAPVTTSWGRDLQLGLQWFTDIEKSTPLDSIARFKGPILVLYGDLDDVVVPRISEQVIAAAADSVEVVRHVIKGAGHGLGLFNGNTAATDEAVNTTVDFFSQRLNINR